MQHMQDSRRINFGRAKARADRHPTSLETRLEEQCTNHDDSADAKTSELKEKAEVEAIHEDARQDVVKSDLVEKDRRDSSSRKDRSH